MKLRLETPIAVQQIVIDIINYELAKKQHNLVFIDIDREKKLCLRHEVLTFAKLQIEKQSNFHVLCFFCTASLT